MSETVVPPLKQFELWVEGYGATGEHGTAQLLGFAVAPSFGAAVQDWNEKNNSDGKAWGNLSYNFHTKTWSLWGCRIFDNEADARASFG